MTAGDVVIDDHLLLRVLINEEPAVLRPNGGRIFTTGLWYHRLGRALAVSDVVETLSRTLGQVEPNLAARAIAAVTELPDTVGLVSLRSLAWPMAELIGRGIRLNLMCLEAMAAAQHLDAEICLDAADLNHPLLNAARHNVAIRLID